MFARGETWRKTVYTEHVSHLLSLLDLSAQTGLLSLSPQEDPSAGPWRAWCELVEGKVKMCKVYQVSDQRVLVGGPLALEWLKAQGGMNWQMEGRSVPLSVQTEVQQRPGVFGEGTQPDRITTTVNQLRASSPTSFPQDSQRPRRTLLGQKMANLSAWSRLQRQVFALVDGERSLVEIVQLLAHRSFKEVEEAIDALRAAGYIE